MFVDALLANFQVDATAFLLARSCAKNELHQEPQWREKTIKHLVEILSAYRANVRLHCSPEAACLTAPLLYDVELIALALPWFSILAVCKCFL